MSSSAGRINNSQQSQTAAPIQPASDSSTSSATDAVATTQLHQEPTRPKRGNLEGLVKCDFPSCKKFLTIVERMKACRCEQMFCRTHSFYTDHRCTYDYHGKERALLKETLETSKGAKTRQWHHGNGRSGSAY